MKADTWDFSRTQWERLIDDWIFSERDRAVIKRRLLDGVTFEKLAEQFDMSPRQIKNIVRRCNERLARHLDTMQ